jgi:hypothetical protein
MMSFRSSITIVASPRPRVGKTLLARLLTEFHRRQGRDVVGYDLNVGEGTLADFVPEHAARAGIGDIKGQMALFDSLVAEDGRTRIVDLGHGAFEAFFDLAERIGFAEEARARGIAPAIMFLMTPDRTSVEAYRDLYRRFPQALLAPVHNEMFGPTQHRDRYPLSSKDSVVRLPALAPTLRRYIETPPFSFDDARMAEMPGILPEGREELERWLRRIFVEFRELDLRILLTDLKASIRFGS